MGNNIDPAALAASLSGGEQPTEPQDPEAPDPSEMVDETDRTIQSPVMTPVETPSEQFGGTAEPPPVIPTIGAKKPPKKPPKRQPQQKKSLFQNLVPPGEKLHVYKRGDTGNLAYVRSYNPGEMAGYGSVESFLKEHVASSYGYGEYSLIIMDAQGNSKPQGSIVIQGPTNQGDGQVNSLAEVFKIQQSMTETAERRSSENMKTLATLMTAMKGGSGDNMMPILMMVMQNNQPKTDPSMQLMMQMMMKKMDEQSFQPPSFPMLPPPPQDTNAADMIRAFAEISKLNQPQQNPLSDVLGTLLAQLVKKDNDKIGTKEIIELIPSLKDMFRPMHGGSGNFMEYMEGMNMLDEMMRERYQSDDSSLWTTLAETVGGIVRDISVAAQQNKVNVAASDVQPGTRGNLPAGQQRKQIDIPAGFQKYAMRMRKAMKKGDEETLVREFFEGLLFLREKNQYWKKYVDQAITFAHQDEKEKSMKFFEAFIKTFHARGFIDADLGNQIYSTMDEYWSDVWETLGFKLKDEEESEPEPESELEPEPDSQQSQPVKTEPEEKFTDFHDPSAKTPESMESQPENAEIAEVEDESDEGDEDEEEVEIPEESMASPEDTAEV